MLQGRIRHTDEAISREGLDNSSAKILPKGTLLLSIFATIGRAAVLDTAAATNQAIVGLIPKNETVVDTKYLRRFLEAQVSSLIAKGRGGAQSNINGRILKEFEIPLPPLDEQKRIAAVLDKADALRRQRQASLQLTEKLLQSVFIDMFGDPATNPKGWDVRKIDDLLSSIDSGWSPKCLDRRAGSGEWGILKLGGVTSCVYDEKHSKALPPSLEPREKLEIESGDVLFSRKNTRQLVAACVYVWDTRSKLMLPDLIFRLNIKDFEVISPLFLWQQLLCPAKRGEIQGYASGAAGSMPNISKANLRKIELIVPSIELQRKFEDIAKSIQNINTKESQSDLKINRLFASLQQRAFRGELDLSRVTLNEGVEALQDAADVLEPKR